LGALLAWIFLGQSLPSRAVMGIGVVIFGIVWVVAERGPNGTGRPELALGRGVIAACLGTLAQAVAFVFSSQGVAGGFAPYSATLIRISAGAIALWAFIAWQGKIRTTAAAFRQDGRLLLLLVGAALLGPVIAGSSLLLSFQYIPVGVSTTLSHTTAIMLIPISYLIFQERITLRAVVGTLVTVAGIAILFR
jgi:drug/metabolite transporter (DMT)-like permease